jgi:hypothetical protein
VLQLPWARSFSRQSHRAASSVLLAAFCHSPSSRRSTEIVVLPNSRYRQGFFRHPNGRYGGDYHGLGVGERGEIEVVGGEGYGDGRPFGLCDWTFDNHMVYFPILIPTFSLAFVVCARTPGDGEDCPMGWECFILLLGSQDL